MEEDEENNGLKAGAWIVLALCVGMVLGFVSCAHASPQADAKAGVDASHKYRFYYGDDHPADAKPYEQNCLGYARAYRAALKERGANGLILPCQYKKYGEYVPHVYVLSDEWVLDNRYAAPVRMADYDCE